MTPNPTTTPSAADYTIARIVRLAGTIDHDTAIMLGRLLDEHPELKLLVLDCVGVRALDPVGAKAVAYVLDEWGSVERRCVEIQRLDPSLRRQIRRHPLARHCAPSEDETLFSDPFVDPEVGAWRPSRH